MFENKKILILGFARSGYEAAKFLSSRGNIIYLNDSKEEEKLDALKIEELRALGVHFIFGSHPDNLLDSSFDYLIKSPGVLINHKYVLKARELGIEVINEVEMAYRLLPKNMKIVGITGTNGKTTTTTLIYNILKEVFSEKVILAGNIGYPLCSFLNEFTDEHILVIEISCQQLENLNRFKPDISVLTNLSPAHIDFFDTYENYKNVKKKIFKNQTSDEIAILNVENSDILELARNIKVNCKYFSSDNTISGAYLENEALYYYGEKVIDCDLIKIVGKHNLENCLAAIMVAKEFGIENDIIIKVLSSFTGVEHRLEYVDEVCGRMFYNDTEATNIKCSQIALASFNKPTILILGGLERGQDFNELSSYMKNVKAIVGIGECRDRILEFGNNLGIETYTYEFLKDAFKKCYDISNDGDIILLSPASASWDQYKECEDCGAEFKKYVGKLKELDSKQDDILTNKFDFMVQ